MQEQEDESEFPRRMLLPDSFRFGLFLLLVNPDFIIPPHLIPKCELPDEEIKASEDPLPPNLKCHRCAALKIDCYVTTEVKPLSARSLKRRSKIAAAEGSENQASSNNPPLAGPSKFNPTSNTSAQNAQSPSTLVPWPSDFTLLHSSSWAPSGTKNEVELEERLRAEASERMLLNPRPLALLNELVSKNNLFGKDTNHVGSGSLSMNVISESLFPYSDFMEKE